MGKGARRVAPLATGREADFAKVFELVRQVRGRGFNISLARLLKAQSRILPLLTPADATALVAQTSGVIDALLDLRTRTLLEGGDEVSVMSHSNAQLGALLDLSEVVTGRIFGATSISSWRFVPSALAVANSNNAQFVREWDLLSKRVYMGYSACFSAQYFIRKRLADLEEAQERLEIKQNLHDAISATEIFSNVLNIPDGFPSGRIPFTSRSGTPYLLRLPLGRGGATYHLNAKLTSSPSWGALRTSGSNLRTLRFESRKGLRPATIEALLVPRPLLAARIVAFLQNKPV